MKEVIFTLIVFIVGYVLGGLMVNAIHLKRAGNYPRVHTTQVCKYVTSLFQENGRWMVDSAIDACHNVKWEGRA